MYSWPWMDFGSSPTKSLGDEPDEEGPLPNQGGVMDFGCGYLLEVPMVFRPHHRVVGRARVTVIQESRSAATSWRSTLTGSVAVLGGDVVWRAHPAKPEFVSWLRGCWVRFSGYGYAFHRRAACMRVPISGEIRVWTEQGGPGCGGALG